MINKIYWPEFKFGPINLWVMPPWSGGHPVTESNMPARGWQDSDKNTSEAV